MDNALKLTQQTSKKKRKFFVALADFVKKKQTQKLQKKNKPKLVKKNNKLKGKKK